MIEGVVLLTLDSNKEGIEGKGPQRFWQFSKVDFQQSRNRGRHYLLTGKVNMHASIYPERVDIERERER